MSHLVNGSYLNPIQHAVAGASFDHCLDTDPALTRQVP